MSRSRTVFLLAGALLLLWLKPWRRLAGRDEAGGRPQWFNESTREVSETSYASRSGSATFTGGFSAGQPADAPEPPAQPAAPTPEAALDGLTTPAADQPRGEGPLSFEVLDDMQGQRSDEAQASGSSDDAPATAASAARDTAPPPTTVGSTGGDDQPSPANDEEPTQRDDLIIIEGIGPRANLVMQGAGITSFARLAETPVDELRQILRRNGIEVLNPETWPAQARLAADGHMDELRALQGRIKNGKLEE